MTWLRRLLGMGKRAPDRHVQEAMDTAAAAGDAFETVRKGIKDYRLARARSNDARDTIIRDYTEAEQRRKA